MFASSEETSIYYLARLPRYKTEKPFYVNFPVHDTPGIPQHNVLHEAYQNIVVNDIRGHEDDFCLDTQGFQLVTNDTSMTNDDFEDDREVRSRYYPEIIKLLTQELGATKVVPFEHTHRLAKPQTQGCGCDRKRKPLTAAHIDQTPGSSAHRVEAHLGDEAQDLLKGRFQVVNVWRPLFGPLKDFPLMVGDYRTFDVVRDGEATDLVFPHFVGESLNLYHHPDHKWYFAREQQRNEVWVFKCFDSKPGVAMAAPHCSFDIQKGSFIERPRESIEVRCLVFYEE